MESQIITLTHELKCREEDLEKAVEIGQALLRAKESLEAEIKSLRQQNEGECSKCYLQSKRIADQEKCHNDLAAEYENTKQMLSTELSRRKALEFELKNLLLAGAKVKDELESNIKENIHLKSELGVISDKNKVLVQDIEYFQSQSQKQPAIAELEESINILNGQLDEKDREIESLAISLTKRDQQEENLKRTLEESEQILENYRSYKEENELLELKVDDLEHTIDTLQEANHKLTSRLAIMEPASANSAPDTGCKTLLTELDDKRVELENQNVELQEKHHGLELSHHKALHQQQRMKHQIARLSQMSTAEENQEKMIKLEQALAQSESERAELEKRLDQLQRQGHFVLPPGFDQDAEVTPDDRARILEFQVESLLHEIQTLRKSNKTVRLVKAAETSKLHEALTLLHESRLELDKLKRENTKLKFKIDGFTEVDEVMKENSISVPEINRTATKPVSPIKSSFVAKLDNEQTPLMEAQQFHGRYINHGKNTTSKSMNLQSAAIVQDHKVGESNLMEPKTIKINRANTQECNQQ